MKSAKIEMNKGLLEAWLEAQSTRTVFLSIFKQEGNTMIVMVTGQWRCLWSMTKVTRCLLWGL